MLLLNNFIEHAKELDKKTNDILPFCIEMNRKYPHLQKLMEHIVRADFTTNGQEDYEEIPLNPPIQQPFYDMLRVVQLKNLFPNFFSEKNKELIKKTAHPNDTHPQATALISLLVWHDFDEKQYLINRAQKQQEIAQLQKHEAIKRNKKKFVQFLRKKEKTPLEQLQIKSWLHKEK